jgi:hypothetical protein
MHIYQSDAMQTVLRRTSRVHRRALDGWFRPKRFESEPLYERLGAVILKRYVPTGGDLVMQRLRRDHPKRRWVKASLQSLCGYERRTRLNQSFQVVAFIAFAGLSARRFLSVRSQRSG